MKTVENLEDALPKGSTPDNGIINDDKVILERSHTAVTDIIDMCSEVVAFSVISNKGTQFDILPHHLFRTYVMPLLTEAVGHTIERHLGSIGDIREHGIPNVTINGFHDGLHQLFSQTLTFLIDVTIRTSAEIDAFKRTRAQLLSR